MRKFSKLLVSAFLISSPSLFAACSSDDGGDGDGDGGSSSSGDGDNSSTSSGDGGAGGGGSSLDCADAAVDADIKEDTTWCADTVYSLEGNIFVHDGATLTIEPGTLIKSKGAESSLIVTRGAKIMAEGTKDEPIVFTSAQPNGKKKRGDWGGVILLGKAKNFKGAENTIEGLPATDLSQHGGDDDKDSSGVLKYVRIEFGGTEISEGNEINGLTLGSVGSGTTISHVMVSTTLDDGFEWFGGTVKCDHLVVNDEGDDMFDADTGYRGTIDTFFGRQIDPQTEDPNGLEWDSDKEGKLEPGTNVKATKGTLCGIGELIGAAAFGAVLRETVSATVDNVAFVGFDYGFDVRDTIDVKLTDSYSWDHTNGLCDANEDDNDGGLDDCAWFTDEASNESEPSSPEFSMDDCLEDDGPSSDVTGSGIGAFKDEADWLKGWTNFSTDSTPEDK